MATVAPSERAGANPLRSFFVQQIRRASLYTGHDAQLDRPCRPLETPARTSDGGELILSYARRS
jgi:hypothetical protein